MDIQGTFNFNLPCGEKRSPVTDLAGAYAYVKMILSLDENFIFYSTDYNGTGYQEVYDKPVVYHSYSDHTEELCEEGWDYKQIPVTFGRGKLYLFRPMDAEEGYKLPVEIHNADELESYIHFLGGEDDGSNH